MTERLIANNMIAVYRNTAADAGIWLESGLTNVYHNTVYMDTGGASRAALETDGSAVGIRLNKQHLYGH